MENQKAVIKLNGEFEAAELEEIIRDLAKVRAGMLPAVPTSPDTDCEPLEQCEPLFKIRTLAGDGVRIWLRNEGFGWLAFTLTANDLASLRTFLGEKLGHTHTAH